MILLLVGNEVETKYIDIPECGQEHKFLTVADVEEIGEMQGQIKKIIELLFTIKKGANTSVVEFLSWGFKFKSRRRLFLYFLFPRLTLTIVESNKL